jgi:hypothetical protein
MRDSLDSQGQLALAMIGGAILAGPILGLWPLVGVIAACGTAIYVANSARRR